MAEVQVLATAAPAPEPAASALILGADDGRPGGRGCVGAPSNSGHSPRLSPRRRRKPAAPAQLDHHPVACRRRCGHRPRVGLTGHQTGRPGFPTGRYKPFAHARTKSAIAARLRDHLIKRQRNRKPGLAKSLLIALVQSPNALPRFPVSRKPLFELAWLMSNYQHQNRATLRRIEWFEGGNQA